MSIKLTESEHSQHRLVDILGEQIRTMETLHRSCDTVIPSGCRAMDACLPAGGYTWGSLLELLTDSGKPVGATTIALRIAREACGLGRYVVLLDPSLPFYPPALASLGLPLERVIGVRPTSYDDLVWAMDQSLRSSAVGCVIASIDRLDDRTARRFQLAVEKGGGLGILLRSASNVHSEPSWAEVQWQVATRNLPRAISPSPVANPLTTRPVTPANLWAEHLSRWFELTLRRCRGGRVGNRIHIGINASGDWIDPPSIEKRNVQASHVHLAAELAKSTRKRREMAG
jgi:hypothetical protein